MNSSITVILHFIQCSPRCNSITPDNTITPGTTLERNVPEPEDQEDQEEIDHLCNHLNSPVCRNHLLI